MGSAGFNNRQEVSYATYRTFHEPTLHSGLYHSHRLRFLNRVSNTYHDVAPPPFYGGIIADPMGLGKTLTMIALAATDLELESSLITEEDMLNDPDNVKQSSSATLIIVPPGCMARLPRVCVDDY
jgi:hypothetical protein